MNILLADIVTNVRYMINDILLSGNDIFTYTASDVFTISESNCSAVTTVYINDIELGSGEWSYSVTTNKLTLTSGVSVISGDTVQIDYTYYSNYSDTELQAYIRTAIMMLSVNGYKTFEVVGTSIYPYLNEDERNLVVLIASVLINPDNKSYRLPDMTITVPYTSMPTYDRIRQIIATFKKSGTFGTGDIL